MKEDNLIQQIKEGDNTALKEIYNHYKLPFLKWILQKFQMSEQDAIELFQFSVVVLYDNIVQEKLTHLDGSVKTYLFAIGRNKAMEWIRLQKKNHRMAEQMLLSHMASDDPGDKTELENKYKMMDAGLQILGDPGKTILVLFYYNRMTMEEIAHKLNYKNAATVKNLKYKSVKRLQNICQDLILTKSHDADFIRRGH